MIGVAAAPVSFGVFELTADGPLPGPDEILTVVRDAGYDAIDLGPVGWLGRGDALAARLRRFELPLCGGWVDLPFSDNEAFRAALPDLDDALSVFTAAAEVDPQRPALPTLADSGSPRRRDNPGGGPGLSLDDDGWRRFAANLTEAVDRVRAAGFVPTFHHHVGTFVETPAEIDRLLELTDIGLTLDTGHLMLGGGDPIQALSHWRERVNHVHIKDVQLSVQRDVVRDGGDMRAVWVAGVFPPLGAGDLDLTGFMDGLVASGFGGWVVVEQDVIPAAGDPPDRPAEHQRANREALRRWFP